MYVGISNLGVFNFADVFFFGEWELLPGGFINKAHFGFWGCRMEWAGEMGSGELVMGKGGREGVIQIHPPEKKKGKPSQTKWREGKRFLSKRKVLVLFEHKKGVGSN